MTQYVDVNIYITCEVSGQTGSGQEGVWVQGGGLEIPCMYDVFVKTERTYRAEEDFERETAFFQATRRWNSLVRCLTAHDHRMNVKYVIKCYGKVRIHYKLNQHYGMLQY